MQKQKYRGQVYRDMFAMALAESRNPVCYNGDLRTVEEFSEFRSAFPKVESVMVGRGAVADPALLRKLQGGPAASREELQHFTAALYREYQVFYGQVNPASQRMKEVWFYLIHLFEGGERYGGRMRRSRGPAEYERIEAEIFRDLPLRDHSVGDLI